MLAQCPGLPALGLMLFSKPVKVLLLGSAASGSATQRFAGFSAPSFL